MSDSPEYRPSRELKINNTQEKVPSVALGTRTDADNYSCHLLQNFATRSHFSSNLLAQTVNGETFLCEKKNYS